MSWHLFLLNKLLMVTLLNTTLGWNYSTRSSTSSFDKIVPPLLTIEIDKNLPSSMNTLIDRLLSYAEKDVIRCLDSVERNNKDLTTNPNPIHLAFIGDSRIRNQFVNFIQVNLLSSNLLIIIL